MKRVLISLMLTCFVFSSAGCAAGAKTGGTPKYETEYENVTEAEYEDENLSFPLKLPEGWSYKKFEKDDLNSDIVGKMEIYPENDSDFKITINSLSQKIGICGTGVTIKDAEFENGLKAKVYYESFKNEGCTWVLFVFDACDGKLTAESIASDKLLKKYNNDITEIFSTLTVKEYEAQQKKPN